MVDIAVVLTAKNEGENVRNLLSSLSSQIIPPSYVVIVDDGCTDDTFTDLASTYPFSLEIISRPNRINGQNIAGTPYLAFNFNLAFDWIEEHNIPYDYILVAGADNLYPPEYLSSLLVKFYEDNNLMIAGGGMPDEAVNHDHVRGGGRMIRKALWDEFGNRYWYPSYYWESGILFYAHMKGYLVRSFPEIIFYSRETGGRGSLVKYGRNFRAMDYPKILVLKKLFDLFIQLKWRILVSLVVGWWQGASKNARDIKFSRMIAKYQYYRLKKKLHLL